MKRLTESQLRQVIREEIINLLKEGAGGLDPEYSFMQGEAGYSYNPQSENKGTKIGSITVSQLLNVLSQIEQAYTLNQQEFKELQFDSRNKPIMNNEVNIYRSRLGDYSATYYNGDLNVDMTLSPKQVTGPASKRFPTVSRDIIVKKINQIYPGSLNLPEAERSSSSYERQPMGPVSQDAGMDALRARIGGQQHGTLAFDKDVRENKKRNR